MVRVFFFFFYYIKKETLDENESWRKIMKFENRVVYLKDLKIGKLVR